MSDESLAGALAALLPGAAVEELGTLAIVTLRDAAPLIDAALRERALAFARAHGVTHLALELADDGGDAAHLPRD
jgi:hypothetical protein